MLINSKAVPDYTCYINITKSALAQRSFLDALLNLVSESISFRENGKNEAED